MPHLDRAVLHGVEHLQAGHDLAGGEDLYLELFSLSSAIRLAMYSGAP